MSKHLFSHSGDFGDIIYSLATLKYFSADTLTLFPSLKSRVILSKSIYENIKELLLTQNYLKTINYSEEPFETPLNNFRYWLKWFSIPESHIFAYSVHRPFALDFFNQTPWFALPYVEPEDKIVFCFTNRKKFNNHFNFNIPQTLATDQNICFVGLQQDYEYFKLNSSYRFSDFIEAKSFLHLAEIIASAKLVIGNPCGSIALAQAMHIPVISCENDGDKCCRFSYKRTLHIEDSYNERALFYNFMSNNNLDIDGDKIMATLNNFA